MRAFVLAGGLGTRIRKVLGETPKPLAPINGRPFLFYLIDLLKSHGFDELVVSVGYRRELIKEALGDGSGLGVRIYYSEEERPLGTGGALKRARPLLEGSSFLLCNGDSYTWGDLKGMMEEHLRLGALVTIGYTVAGREAKGGFLEVENGVVRGFREGVGRGLMSTGFLAMSPEVFAYMPDAEEFSLEMDLMPRLVATGRARAYYLGDRFVDIGTPEGYERARAMLQ